MYKYNITIDEHTRVHCVRVALRCVVCVLAFVLCVSVFCIIFNKTVDYKKLSVLLLLHQAKTTEQIWMKLGTGMIYIINQNVEYFLSQKKITVNVE